MPLRSRPPFGTVHTLCCLVALSLMATSALSADAQRFLVPQHWAVGDAETTYQEWDRFAATTNNAPDIGVSAVPAASGTSLLSAVQPGALSGTGNFYAFGGDYAFVAEVFNNGGDVGSGWGTHVIVQVAASLGSGDSVLDDTLMIVDTNGAAIAGGESTASLRYDALGTTTFSSPAGTVTQFEEFWEFFLTGHTGNFVVKADLKQHSSLRQVRIDTQRAPKPQPLLRLPLGHPEADFIDFANPGSIPCSLGSFGPGLHVITAHFGDDGSNNDDGDLFTFRVPDGYEWVGLRALSYATTNLNGSTGSFLALASGTDIGTTLPTATNHLSNMLIAGPGDLLGPLAQGAYSGASSLVSGQPLPAGDYTLFVNEITASVDLVLAITIAREPLQFQLLTWNDTRATTQLPSAGGRKPSATMPTAGDWLVFTADDVLLMTGDNPAGAASHNFVDITGAGGSGHNMSPSLSGELSVRLESVSGQNWLATITSLGYSGQANAVQMMNQFLVTPGSPAAIDGTFNVDGVGNTGQWSASASDNWAIQYVADFHFATSADGDPTPTDVDATFNDKPQTGFLIPVNQLTSDGLETVALDDSLGFHSGDLEQYLLEQIKPRLPANATYLLLTQMAKTHPDYAEAGLPITTNSMIGNTTIAYTTQTLSTPPHLVSLHFAGSQAVIRFNGDAGHGYALQRSGDLGVWETVANPALTYPEVGVVEWTDTSATNERQFYRVVTITP